MRTLSTLLFLVMTGIFAFTSCDKGELGPVASSDPGAPSITSPKPGQNYTLSRDQVEDTLMTIEWTEPDFGFAAAPTYTVELGIAGNNFANPMEIATVQQTSYAVVVNSFNETLLSAGLAGGQSHSMELRVTASVSDSVPSAVSESVSITLTPFQADFPPIYMIGEAVGGWDPALAVTVPSTEPNVYSTLAEFVGGETFRFFGQQDWNPDSWNYPYFSDGGGTIDELLVNANDGDSNFRFTGTSGWYRITVNMETLSVEMKPAEEPVMYMTGAALGAWDTPGTGQSIKMEFVQEGVFEATTEFTTDGDANFRFFAQADWSPVSYNYPYFADNDGEIDVLLINAEDADSNFEFVGTTGEYYIKVDINNYTVEMEAAN